jgi:hypothetical protein
MTNKPAGLRQASSVHHCFRQRVLRPQMDAVLARRSPAPDRAGNGRLVAKAIASVATNVGIVHAGIEACTMLVHATGLSELAAVVAPRLHDPLAPAAVCVHRAHLGSGGGVACPEAVSSKHRALTLARRWRRMGFSQSESQTWPLTLASMHARPPTLSAAARPDL